jgi:NitT/TauT family transport system permease protein
VPGPRLTILGLWEITRSGVLARNVVASLFRVSFGFTFAVVSGVPLGLLIGWNARAHLIFNPVVQALRPISPIAWLPVATLLMGSGDLAAVFLIWLSAFFPIVVSTAAAVRDIDPRYLRAAANFDIRGLLFVRQVMVPAAMPQIVTALRVALGIAWVVVVAAEMLGVSSGLGYQVNDGRNNLRFDLVVAAMVVIGVIGYVLDSVLRALERREAGRFGSVRAKP